MRVHWYFGDTGVCIVDVIYVMVKFPYQSTIIKKTLMMELLHQYLCANLMRKVISM